MASSSRTPPVPNSKYDVFVSFRGGDSRNIFVSHLRAAFYRRGINAFIDDRLDKGEEISETLSTNISNSLASVVVLTPNYADSRWCMDELQKIMECKAKGRQTVLPIFLEVEPTHVRKQTGAFGNGFRRLTEDPKFQNKEETWRRALLEIANLSGWNSNDTPEANIIDGVVQRIEEMMNQTYSKESDDFFVGNQRVEEIISLLCRPGVSSIGIWGMAGVGKTTIAKKVFHKISQHYNGTCFLATVSERLKREGEDALSKDMLSQLLQSENLQTPPRFSSLVVRRSLERKKLLVILDDVDDSPQLQTLAEKRKFYGPGSRIILTSKDKQILRSAECDDVYEVKGFDIPESLQMLKHRAFKQQRCTEEYKELLTKAVDYAQGLPLALEVMGRHLCDMSTREWEDELTKLEKIPDKTIKNILKLSFDGLEEQEKEIFLYIACIFQGEDRTKAGRILNACGYCATPGTKRLLDKALIDVANEKFWMHDLLQQMGRDIVRAESKVISERSRLWDSKDIHDVLTNRKIGTIH